VSPAAAHHFEPRVRLVGLSTTLTLFLIPGERAVHSYLSRSPLGSPRVRPIALCELEFAHFFLGGRKGVGVQGSARVLPTEFVRVCEFEI
jgi:hypothetical protein